MAIFFPRTSLLTAVTCLILPTPPRRRLRCTTIPPRLLVFYVLTFVTVQEATPDRVHEPSQNGGIKKVIQARNAHVAAAVEAGSLDPWSKESIFLYWCAFITFLCSCANGYVSLISMISPPTY
jgi:hypothetical protein